MIFYILPEVGIWGGIKKAFHYVEHLTASGLAAAVATPGAARPTWFACQCAVVARETLVVKPDDAVIFSWAPDVTTVFQHKCHHKILHMQDARDATLELLSLPQLSIIASGLFIYNECLKRGRVAQYVPYGISDCFSWRGAGKKPLSVAVMPRKNPEFVEAVRTAAPQLQLNVIDRMSEVDVAAALAQADMFVPMSVGEWIGLPPLEAMKAGCCVVGFPGLGGAEFLHHGMNAFVVPNGSAEALSAAVRLLAADAGDRDRLRAGALTTASRYGMQQERQALLQAMQRISGPTQSVLV